MWSFRFQVAEPREHGSHLDASPLRCHCILFETVQDSVLPGVLGTHVKEKSNAEDSREASVLESFQLC